MSIRGKKESSDAASLRPPGRLGGTGSPDIKTLRPGRAGSEATAGEAHGLVNVKYTAQPAAGATQDTPTDPPPAAPMSSPAAEAEAQIADVPKLDLSPSEQAASTSKIKRNAKDQQLLTRERWLARHGHTLTYACLYLFTVMVFFRPYELVPGLGFLSGTAIVFAIATLVVYLPSQFAAEGNLTIFPTEVKAVLAMTVIALISVPIAKSPAIAWETFNDAFIKAVLMFIVMVNVIRTRRRLMGVLWLSIGIGIYLAVAALDLYAKGKFAVEEYRIAVDVGGMFGNPNEMAMHFVMMTPLAITLAIASKNLVWKFFYFAIAILFVAANMVTFSRGGFIGLLACCAVLAWKLGRRHRLNVTVGSIIIGLIAIIAAPGNYGLRMLSIFIPGLDAVGSSDQRQELLMRSLLVSARNPWGIGIGNFPIVGIRNLQSHNAYTQVSAELGILGLIAYVVFMVSPFRRLGAIERSLFDREEQSWFFYLAIGLQASIIGFMVSSFFASVAYNWFVYYLIAYAVAFRRIYAIENNLVEEVKPRGIWHREPVPTT